MSSLRTWSRALATALALVTTTSVAFAQELRWNLPARGAALYRRTLQVESTQEPTQAWIPGVWFGEPMVAAVMASELAPDRQRLLEPASDPRDLLACIALDLRLPRGGKTRLEVETFDRFFPLQVDVVLGEPAADGSQTISATIEVDQKAARVASTNPNIAKLRGKLQGRRVVDREKGLVTAIEGSAEFTVDYPAFTEGTEVRPVRKQQIRVVDAWTLDTVLAPDDAEFRTRVAKAIRDSVAALQKELTTRLDGKFDDGGVDPHHEHRPGELALVLLALKRAGEDARGPLLQKGYDTLRRLVIAGSYELGVAILAMEALYTPASEWEDLRAGRLKAPLPRTSIGQDIHSQAGAYGARKATTTSPSPSTRTPLASSFLPSRSRTDTVYTPGHTSTNRYGSPALRAPDSTGTPDSPSGVMQGRQKGIDPPLPFPRLTRTSGR